MEVHLLEPSAAKVGGMGAVLGLGIAGAPSLYRCLYLQHPCLPEAQAPNSSRHSLLLCPEGRHMLPGWPGLAVRVVSIVAQAGVLQRASRFPAQAQDSQENSGGSTLHMQQPLQAAGGAMLLCVSQGTSGAMFVIQSDSDASRFGDGNLTVSWALSHGYWVVSWVLQCGLWKAVQWTCAEHGNGAGEVCP